MSNRNLWWVAIALGTLLLLSLLVAPSSSESRQGSTYSRSPDGYGAWYASLQEQGIAIQRWQRPLEELMPDDLPEEEADDIETIPISVPDSGSLGSVRGLTLLQGDVTRQVSTEAIAQSPTPNPQPPIPKSPITLLRVNPALDFPLSLNPAWIRQGNVLIILGVRSKMTQAPFRSTLAGVKIATSRRANLTTQSNKKLEQRLGDRHGAVVWEMPMGKGKVIFAATPYLAANAYQDEPGNFKFLTKLVTEAGHPIWVDEYVHGYIDQEVKEKAASRSWLRYLAKTPLALLALQAVVFLLVLVWGQNRRFGPPAKLEDPKVDNSTAYIQALGSVLNKAECSEFVLSVVGKAEQLNAQRALGLGSGPTESDALVQAWQQQTGRSADELWEVLRPIDRKRRIGERDLLIWLGKLKAVRRYLP